MKTCTKISQKSGGTPREWVGIGVGLVWMLIATGTGLDAATVTPAGSGIHSLAYARDGRLGELVREQVGTNDPKLQYRETQPGGQPGAWQVVVDSDLTYQGDLQHAALFFDLRDQPVVMLARNTTIYEFARVDANWSIQYSWPIPSDFDFNYLETSSWTRDMDGVIRCLLFRESFFPDYSFFLVYGKLVKAPASPTWEQVDSFVNTTEMTGFDYPGIENVDYVLFPRNLDLAVETSGSVHVVYSGDQVETPVSGGTEVRSFLFYRNREPGGTWSPVVSLVGPAGGSFGDGGIGASIAVAQDGTVAIAATYLPRAATGSPGRCELRYLVKETTGSWSDSLVTRTSDNYLAGDGERGSGIEPTLIFDGQSKPHIAMTDHASQHYPGLGAQSFSGQVRYATRNSPTTGDWSLSKLVSRGSHHPLDFQTFRPAIATRFGQIAVCSTSWTWDDGSESYLPDYEVILQGQVVLPQFKIDIVRLGNGDLSLSWESEAGMLYRLRSATELSSDPPITWPVFSTFQDIAATPPLNAVTFPLPAEAARFFVAQEYLAPPPPLVTVFSDGFEGGQGSWVVDNTIEGNTPVTHWELGAPDNTLAGGPATANGGTNCFGTNLADDTGLDVEIFLVSPVVDLTAASGATLNFAHFRDIVGDFEKVRILDSDNADAELAVLETDINGQVGWEVFSETLPVAALGKNVKFEFSYTTAPFSLGPSAGWYLDDVEVTVP